MLQRDRLRDTDEERVGNSNLAHRATLVCDGLGSNEDDGSDDEAGRDDERSA